MPYAIVNIGTNLGNRRLNIARAVGAIINRFGEYIASHIVESAPWGFDSANPFLNICVMFSTDLDAEALLRELQDIERSISSGAHRNADGSYADRIIDIDLIDYDRQIISSPTLTLPHPHLPERRFFLAPLAEIAPAWTHPGTGLSAGDMLAALPEDSRP